MELSNYIKIFKALSNEQRLKLFKMIYKWDKSKEEGQKYKDEGVEKSFTKACECLNLSRSTISHHFKELQNADLITCIRKGQTFTCKVNKRIINAIKSFMD